MAYQSTFECASLITVEQELKRLGANLRTARLTTKADSGGGGRENWYGSVLSQTQKKAIPQLEFAV